MAITAFLQEAFRYFGGEYAAPTEPVGIYRDEKGLVSQAVEHVVEEISPRMRAIPGYRRRLQGPVTAAFRHIDSLVERIPDSFQCSRSTFSSDPRVRAFFVSPRHMQEVFSHCREVRELFEARPLVEECCALVCMHMEERRIFGTALSGEHVQREVMQTSVSFTQHQLYSPGESEPDARRALKCCIFNSILAYIRQQLAATRTGDIQRREQLSRLRSRVKATGDKDTHGQQQSDLQERIQELENEVLQTARRPVSIEDHLDFVADVLNESDRFIRAGFSYLRLSHMGIKVGQDSKEPSCELDVAEIRVAGMAPRVAALVRFARGDLLPKEKILQRAGLLFSA